MGLLDFLFGRGRTGGDGSSSDDRDGSTPAKAVVVGSVGAEYGWMQRKYPGYGPKSQSLQEIDGKPYDVLVWGNAEGAEVTVYFDISSFFGR